MLTDDMTKESLIDTLVYADIPSRTVLTSVLQDGLLKKSIFASNAFIYHFDDIRDAIDLVLKGLRDSGGDKHIINNSLSIGISRANVKTPQPPAAPLVFHLSHQINCLKMNELFDSEEVRFACTRGSEDLLNSRNEKSHISLPSATILVSLNFLDHSVKAFGSVPFERVDVLMEKIKSLLIEFGGPVLAFSEIKRNLQTGTTFKFFAEFYRISDCKKFLDTNERIGSPIVSDQNVQVTFEGVELYDIDREALFFSSYYDDQISTAVPSEGEEDQIAPEQRRKNSISSIEGIRIRFIITFYILTVLLDVISESVPYATITSMSSSSVSYSSSSFTSNSSSSSSFSSSANFEIDLWKIESNLEKRTTCMIRNIPNKYTQQMIFDLVNETHRGCFDFLYLRMDFRNRCNVGYAFINFTKPEHILTFAQRVNGKRWARFNSDKVCHLTFARIQGIEALIEKFRNSKVMFEAPAYRPKLFHTEGTLIGQEIPFPT